MAFCLLIPASGCSGKKTEKQTDSDQQSGATKALSESKSGDAFYKAEEIKVNLPELDPNMKVRYRALGRADLLDNEIVFEYWCEYEMNQDLKDKADKFTMNPQSMNKDEADKLMAEYGIYQQEGKLICNLDGSVRALLQTEIGTRSVTTLFNGKDGKLIAAVDHYSGTLGECSKVTLEEVSEKGELVNPIPLEGTNAYFNWCRQLENGNFVCVSSDRICVFDPQGKKLSEATFSAGIQTVLMQDGRLFISAVDWDVDVIGNSAYVQEFDFQSGQLKKERIPIGVTAVNMAQGKDGVYLTDSKGLRKIDLINQTSKEILTWQDTDVNPNSITCSNILTEDEFYLLRVTETWDRYFSQTVDPDIRLTHIMKSPDNPNAGKKIIRMACAGGNPPDVLMDQIVAYNKDPNNTCRVVIQNYSSEEVLFPTKDKGEESSEAAIIDRAYLDLMSGTVPDILVNFGDYSQFNSGEILMDRNTLIDGDNGVKRDEYFDNLFRACEQDGKLYQIPLFITAGGAVANEQILSGKTSWTYDDILSISGTLPSGTSPIVETSKIVLLRELMAGYGSKLVDYDKKEVHFDDPDFKKMLEVANRLGSNRDQDTILLDQARNMDYTEDLDKLRSGVAKMHFADITSQVDYAKATDLQGDKGILIGNPGCDGGLSLNYKMSIAIPKNSGSQTEAWEFIRYILEKDQQMTGAAQVWAFPVRRDAAEALFRQDIERYNRLGGFSDPTEKEYFLSLPKIDDNSVKGTMEMLGNIHTMRSIDETVFMIIAEEAPAYFLGNKSLDDVVSSIQNRAATVVKERS